MSVTRVRISVRRARAVRRATDVGDKGEHYGENGDVGDNGENNGEKGDVGDNGENVGENGELGDRATLTLMFFVCSQE